MIRTTPRREFLLFSGYFLGYSLLLFPVLFFIFNGRAFGAEAAYRMEKIRESVFATEGGIGWRNTAQSIPQSTPPPEVANPFPAGQAPHNNKLYAGQTSILIPKIGVEAPIVFSKSTDNKSILQDLRFGVSHYPASAMFGEKGVSILLGHSSAYPTYRGKYGAVFSLLNKLEAGDEFYVSSHGKLYTYRVENTKIVVPKDFQVDYPGTGSHLILMSCWPVGTNWQRIVIFSTLIK